MVPYTEHKNTADYHPTVLLLYARPLAAPDMPEMRHGTTRGAVVRGARANGSMRKNATTGQWERSNNGDGGTGGGRFITVVCARKGQGIVAVLHLVEAAQHHASGCPKPNQLVGGDGGHDDRARLGRGSRPPGVGAGTRTHGDDALEHDVLVFEDLHLDHFLASFLSGPPLVQPPDES